MLNKTPSPLRQDSVAPTEDHKATPPAPLSLPGKPGDKVDEKPRFDFYKILPGGQDAAKPASAKPAPAQTAPAKPAEKQPSVVQSFNLQVGAYQKAADADNIKAKLALMGMEASVQQVDVPEKGILYRVRLGPYTNVDELNKARARLAQNGLESTLVRAK
jgi:cell division protein FtsN